MAGRWSEVAKMLTRAGPLAGPDFDPTQPLREFLADDCRILVVGAGGLGCELLKDLALSGFGHIDVIDMDTIDLSNLNRQFLFRMKDVGKFKAQIAADFINARVQGCTVTPHCCRIEEKDTAFYRQFHLVVCGLDSIVARRWINSMLLGLVQFGPDGSPLLETQIPYVDGGTEGFKGNARVIVPFKTACIECTMDLYPPQVTYPMCTLANTPRLPEHCIEYAKVVQWPQQRPDMKLDGDDPEHIKWLLDRAGERAAQYGISGVTYRLTQGVVKNIIPAVASTNAVIAAACANEAFKLATSCHPSLENYLMFSDTEGVFGYAHVLDRKDDCFACGGGVVALSLPPHMTLKELREELKERANLRLLSPSLSAVIRGRDVILYMENPPALKIATSPNLDKTIEELGFVSPQTVSVTDPTSPKPITLLITIV